jgi:hypothetical protein
MKRRMSNNHRGLLTKLIPIMFINSQKLYMVLNKLLEFGMKDLVLSFFQMVLLGVKMTLPYLLKRKVMISY